MSSTKLDTPTLAEKYDQYLGDSQFNNGLNLIEKLGIETGNNVLDIGCGTGRLAEYVAKTVGKKGKVTGIDPSPHRIKVASRKGKPSLNLSFELGNGEDLSRFKNKSFDRVYLNAVFHWIENKSATLAQIHRILKPGGKLGLTFTSKNIQKAFSADRQAVDRLLKKEPYASAVKSDEETPRHPITTDELALLLINSGFEDIKLDIKQNTTYYPSAKEYFEKREAGGHGNFLTNVPEELREQFKADYSKELEKNKTPQGIEFTNYSQVATATNNGWNNEKL